MDKFSGVEGEKSLASEIGLHLLWPSPSGTANFKANLNSNLAPKLLLATTFVSALAYLSPVS